MGLAPVTTADFLLFQGTQALVTSMEKDGEALTLFHNGEIDSSVQEVMNSGIARGLPAVCANQDFQVVQSTGTAYMPGVLAQEYRGRGGKVKSFGKPDADFFKHAVEIAKKMSKTQIRNHDASVATEGNHYNKKFRVLHVGDSLHHDIFGAHQAGIDSLMVSVRRTNHVSLPSLCSVNHTNLNNLNQVTGHGIHKDFLYREEEIGKEEEKGRMKFKCEYTEEKVLTDGITEDCIAEIRSTYSMKPYSSKQQILSRVVELCAEEGIPRPTYIIESLVW